MVHRIVLEFLKNILPHSFSFYNLKKEFIYNNTIQITARQQSESSTSSQKTFKPKGNVYYASITTTTTVNHFGTLINTYIKGKKCSYKVFHAPFDVKLSDKPLTIVQPDIMVICDRNKLDGKRCNGARNAADDYIHKLYYYKNAKVREY